MEAEKPKHRLPAFAFSVDNPTEGPISNNDFLESYVQVGAWLRLIQVYEQIRIIRSKPESSRRLASVAAVFTNLGALVEDVNATLLSWICWHRSPGILLADVLSNASFNRDEKQTPSESYLNQVVDSLIAGKRTRVDPQILARSLVGKGAILTLRALGLDWKRNPSVKVAKGDELNYWDKLPRAVEEVLTVLSSPSTLNISLAYNKIKHGPQIVVSNVLSYVRAMGSDDTAVKEFEDNLKIRGLSSETLRVLFKGSQTKKYPDQPFPTLWLDDDTEAIEVLLAHGFYNLGKVSWMIAMWLRKRQFGGQWFVPPKVVMEMEADVDKVRAAMKFRRLFGSEFTIDLPPIGLK